MSWTALPRLTLAAALEWRDRRYDLVSMLPPMSSFPLWKARTNRDPALAFTPGWVLFCVGDWLFRLPT